MPTYSFKDKETGDITERIMKMSELDSYKVEHPELELVISGGSLCDTLRLGEGLLKGKNAAFKEVLQKIDKRTPGSCLKYTTDI
jgi:hypothetical protein